MSHQKSYKCIAIMSQYTKGSFFHAVISEIGSENHSKNTLQKHPIITSKPTGSTHLPLVIINYSKNFFLNLLIQFSTATYLLRTI